MKHIDGCCESLLRICSCLIDVSRKALLVAISQGIIIQDDSTALASHLQPQSMLSTLHADSASLPQ